MTNHLNVNLKVLIMDTDFYALQALNSYLAWDRRTRVTKLAESIEEMWAYIDDTPVAELPDVVLLDADHIGGTEALKSNIDRLCQKIEAVTIICLSQFVDPALVEVAANSPARAFMLKQEARLKIAWAIVYSLDHDFVVTAGVHKACQHLFNSRIFHAAILPDQREYPELTDRVRQAIQLCVIEGMPAHLAADEMGISLHTIRGYIKEGYRILEAYDNDEYPNDMTPQERAFMRFTALAENEEETEESEEEE
jgi:DNA-binding NarL/FixJ family response regulator